MLADGRDHRVADDRARRPGDVRALEFSVPRERGAGLRARAPAHHLGRPAAAVGRRAGRALLRRGHALQPRRPRVPGEGVSRSSCASMRDRVHLAAISRCRSSAPPGSNWSARRGRSPACAGACATRRCSDPANHVGYFHATYRDHPTPEAGQRSGAARHARQRKAAATGPASFVGTSFIFSHTRNLDTLEGDPRFFFDDSQTPQAQGTGTEEWGGGGDYWGGRNMTLPFAGHPVGARERRGRRRTTRTRSSRPIAFCSPT